MDRYLAEDLASRKPSQHLMAIEWRTSRIPRPFRIAFGREPWRAGTRDKLSQTNPFQPGWSEGPGLVRRWGSASGSRWRAYPRSSRPQSRLAARCNGALVRRSRTYNFAAFAG